MTCSREISNNRVVYRSEVSSTGHTKLTPFCVRRNTLTPMKSLPFGTRLVLTFLTTEKEGYFIMVEIR